MKTLGTFHTCGDGLWSSQKTSVNCTGLDLIVSKYSHVERSYGELRAYFDPKEWDVEKVGLIYTDSLWLKGLRKTLFDIGFSLEATLKVDYSEQGMQGDNYVSLDVSDKFIDEARLLKYDLLEVIDND